LHDSLRQELAQTGMPADYPVMPAEVHAIARTESDTDEDSTMQNQLLPDQTINQPIDPQRAAEKALWLAAHRLKRLLFRGLDYLPPGEASFADLGRAMLAADTAYHLDSDHQRDWLCEEFITRGIVAQRAELEVPVNFEERVVSRLDLNEFLASDWLAYDFANRNRDFLHIPKKLPFRVHPRLAVKKKYYHREGSKPASECLFKVSWTSTEPNKTDGGLPATRRVIGGTTLAIDWETKQVRALLTLGDSDDRRIQRDNFLKRLLAEDLLRTSDRAAGFMSRPMQPFARAEITGGALRVRGTACMMELNRV
jgi:hypothetical protein